MNQLSVLNLVGQETADNSSSGMNRLTSLLCSLLLCGVFAATDLVACNDNNSKYRTASASTGILTTVAGSKTLGGGSIENGIPGLFGIALDKENNLYIAGMKIF